MILGLIGALGYAASDLTLATFAQRAMLPIGIMAIGAHFCFIGYGAMGQFMPVLILHVILLLFNPSRLRMLMSVSDPGRAQLHGKADEAPAIGGPHQQIALRSRYRSAAPAMLPPPFKRS